MTAIRITDDPDSDALLSADPLALLIGMALDQQIPMEKAFKGPLVLQERLGTLTAQAVAEAEDIPGVFAKVPAIHRFPGSMGTRVQELCRHLVETYDGKVERVWSDAKTGDELLARLEAMPGFGTQKAQIFLALLGKQLKVRPKGWREAAGAYGEDRVFRSVADVTSPASLLKVRAYKQDAKSAAKQKAAIKA